MAYRFAQEPQDYSDLAAGAVFHGLPGHPAFPVRLTSEIFQRCLNIRSRAGQDGPCTVYDPCCGGGYLLATLTLLHWHDIEAVYASDVDGQALEVAARNLNLLTLEGIEQRIEQIETMISQYDKPSHKAAYQSAQRIKDRLLQLHRSHSITMHTFNANVITGKLADHFLEPVDLVMADIPYGSRSSWIDMPNDTAHEPSWPIWAMLQSLLSVLSAQSVVAIASNKQQKIVHERYQRVEHFQLGKRRVVILKPLYESQ